MPHAPDACARTRTADRAPHCAPCWHCSCYLLAEVTANSLLPHIVVSELHQGLHKSRQEGRSAEQDMTHMAELKTRKVPLNLAIVHVDPDAFIASFMGWLEITAFITAQQAGEAVVSP